MKSLLFSLLLLPLVVLSQASTDYPVFENGMITAIPAKITEFEAGMAAHNKKYHSEGVYGARVYLISNGPNVGKYMWTMGPLPWTALDQRPAQEGHDADWNTNVLPYTMAEGDQTYWRFHPELSGFPADFKLKYLKVMMMDIQAFKEGQFFGMLKKVKQVMATKYPDANYGMYTNELPSTADGRDFAFVDFFDSMGFMSREDTFPADFDAVHGAGSFASFLQEMQATIAGTQTEIWIFREDLSGLGATVSAASRQ